MAENQTKQMDGDELKRRRVSLGLTQKQLAEQWGISQVTISMWETGKWTIRHGLIMTDAFEGLKLRLGL